MATRTDFEHRRRERIRRERRRRKRRRALFLLILFIIVIVLLCVLISRCAHKNDTALPGDNAQLEQTASPSSSPLTASAEPIAAANTTVATAPNIPPASEENDLMEIIRNSGQSKTVYLTFDDGPTDNITPQILDTLRRYNVKATFFQIGSLIKTNPDMARRVYEEGHLIANHSDGHNYAKLYVSTETFMNEVNVCYEAIKDVTGTEPFKLVRFPGGSFRSDADSYSSVKQECKEALKRYGFYHCDWNALNGDAEGKSKDADELYEYMIETLDGEDSVVVLMHDAATKQATADALPKIIKYFMDNGYRFCRLDEIDYKSGSSLGSVSSSNNDEDDEDGDDEDDDDDENTATPAATSLAITTTPAAAASSPAATSAADSSAQSSSSGSNSSGVIIIQ